MNHPYLWEVARDDLRYKTRCKLCHEEKKHTVNHYIYECIELENVREKCKNQSEIRVYMEKAIVI